MVTPAPSSAVRDRRSPRKTRARGIANIGAVDESTAETATPAYLTDATNITELTAVRTLSATSRARAAPPIRPRPRSEEHTLNSSHGYISYAVFCLKKKKKKTRICLPARR